MDLGYQGKIALVTGASSGIGACIADVKTNVAEYALVRGQPAVFVCDVREIRTKVDERYVYPYPWVRHFVEGEDVTRPAIALKELRRQPAARSPDPPGASQGHPDGS